MVINRDLQGLDISCKLNWQASLDKTLDYLELTSSKGIWGFIKSINYAPRKHIKGTENADQKRRECLGPMHYEYHLVGEVSKE